MGEPVDGTLPLHVPAEVGKVYAGGAADTLAARHPYLPQAHEAVFSSDVLPHEVGTGIMRGQGLFVRGSFMAGCPSRCGWVCGGHTWL